MLRKLNPNVKLQRFATLFQQDNVAPFSQSAGRIGTAGVDLL
jgi:hypothetical protein